MKKIKNENREKELIPPDNHEKDQDYIQMEQKTWKSNINKLYLFQLASNFFLVTGVLVPFFIEWGKISFFEAMCIQSYFMIMILIFEIPCGAIADRTSRRFSLIIGGISGAFGAIIYSIYPSIINFLIGETFFAFSMASISGTDQALMYDTLQKLDLKEEMSKKMGNAQTLRFIGIGLSAPIGSIVAEFISLQMTMTLSMIPLLIGALIAITIKEPNGKLKKEEKDNYYKIVKSGIMELKNNNKLRILGFELILIESLVFFMIWAYQPHLERLDVPVGFFGIIALIMTISQVFFTKLLSYLEAKIKKKSEFIKSYTLTAGILLILLAFMRLLPGTITLIVVISGLGLSRNILFINGINHQIETNNRATVLSTINMFGSILNAIIHPLFALILTWNHDAVYLLIGSIIILSVVLSRIKNEYL
ncbi:MAG: MFS transporter [Candidatus Lokiarchaeota archaeon]|nr:MFS transporter [Candidatus Lokiarchaeota archaeon]